jgi:3-dehydroquinate synthase
LISITVGLGERSYRIDFGEDIVTRISAICHELNLGKKVAVVTNPTVGLIYFDRIRSALEYDGFSVHRIDIPDGEKYKNFKTLEDIIATLIDSDLDRGSFVIALGGGVVGDIAGFAAAIYLRGIPFIQVPTTLLAQVDSSVGGKTGINHEKGKNLIGSFYQPSAVLIDVMTLDSLPEREFLSGMAEVIKYGVTLDRDLFNLIFDNVDKLLARDKGLLLSVIKQSCSLKASIVVQDEKETGLRAVLNYGHTFGHAVESLTSYLKYSHGEAVAIGMVQATRISRHLGYCAGNEADRVEMLIRKIGLPTDLPRYKLYEYKESLLRDKKARDKGLNFVFNKGIGDFHIDKVIDIENLIKIVGIGD